MKKIVAALFLQLLFLTAFAQNIPTQTTPEVINAIKNIKPWEQVLQQQPDVLHGNIINHSRSNAAELGVLPYDTLYAPFYHGVASGDPMNDRVIIWTRVTPQDDNPVSVQWNMATDPDMTNIIQTGTFVTDASRDYTVKIDVTGLSPGATYYYNFAALGITSMTGRTQTVPTGNVNHLRFGVASCSHYQQGYFNAYGRLADRTDLNAVIHLGDYIYEYGPGTDFSTDIRQYEPENEIITLEDYRTRHSLYKLDPDLRRAHQQHPFITVWDDHEVANDAWQEGAQNHNPGEGDYDVRKANAIQAYFEWMPIRDPEPGQPRHVYRTLHYGNLADLIMIDTRHEGRQEQVADFTDPAYSDPNRTILGEQQYNWLVDQLSSSTAQWKVLGNQVVFTTINTLGLLDNADMWDGYPAERQKIAHLIDSLQIKNFVVVTGDIHLGIAADITLEPQTGYDPATGEGAFGVEMVTTSITSANDEVLPAIIPVDVAENLALNANPHAKYINIADHGYFVLDLTPQQAQADWYVIDTKLQPSTVENYDAGRYTLNQTSHLITTTTPAPPIDGAPDPAPVFTSVNQPEGTPHNTGSVLFIAAYPNPTSGGEVHLHYAVSKAQNLLATLHDASGKQLAIISNQQQQPGIYTLKFDTGLLPNGAYICRLITADGSAASRKIVVQR